MIANIFKLCFFNKIEMLQLSKCSKKSSDFLITKHVSFLQKLNFLVLIASQLSENEHKNTEIWNYQGYQYLIENLLLWIGKKKKCAFAFKTLGWNLRYLLNTWHSSQALWRTGRYGFSSVVSDSLWPHGPQHARPPCPSPTPEVYSNSCPLSRWCHPSISSCVFSSSSCPPSFPASGSFQMSQFFASDDQVLEFKLQLQSFQWIFRTDCSSHGAYKQWFLISGRPKSIMHMVIFTLLVPFQFFPFKNQPTSSNKRNPFFSSYPLIWSSYTLFTFMFLYRPHLLSSVLY